MKKLLVTLGLAILLQVSFSDLSHTESETYNGNTLDYLVYEEHPKPWGIISVDKPFNQTRVVEVFNDKTLS